MRKTYKIFALTAAAMICIGIVFLTIGLAAGALPVLHVGTVDTEDFSEDFSDVTSVRIKMGKGTLRIEEGALRVEAKNILKDTFSCTKSGQTLEIKETNKNGFYLFGIHPGFWDWDYDPTITLYLPADYKLDELHLDAGVGDVSISSLIANKADFDMGVGKVTIDKLECDELIVDGGVGDTTIRDGRIKKADLQSGVGSVRIDGSILGDSRFDSGVGNLVLNLKGKEDDYRFEVSSGVGEVRVNDNKVSGTGKNTLGDSDAPYTFHINGGVGKVTIQIEE